jgi:hypothetical protein
MAKYNNSGWHFQSVRHSNAKRYGHAGGAYSKVTYSKKVPEGYAFVDWKDDEGKIWKDVMPKDALKYNANISLRATKITLSKDDEWRDEQIKKSSKHYGSPSLQYIPVPDGLSDANNFPVQVSTIVPSTDKEQKPVSPEEFDKRKDEMKNEFDKAFGADTKIEEVGSYWDGKQKVVEDGAIVESSMSRERYKKNIDEALKIIKEKGEEWGQQSMMVGIEGRKFLIPKQKDLDSDKDFEKRPIQINA